MYKAISPRTLPRHRSGAAVPAFAEFALRVPGPKKEGVKSQPSRVFPVHMFFFFLLLYSLNFLKETHPNWSWLCIEAVEARE